ncbi:MAG: methyltransferase domain-containing protein, partial [Sphingobacteriales bacterium]|nr:methyltransferase domain-containing protein [Sphingobacteriales bacterium]
MKFFNKETKSGLEAMEAAQWIAFAPVVFQSARVLRDSGILKVIDESSSTGVTLEEIAEKVDISFYGVRVLVESGLGIGLVIVNDHKYTLTKTGYFILKDRLTKVNLDFVHDVCYKGLFTLEESIAQGKPVGLKEIGNWDTLYQGLSEFPEKIKKSWLDFDHYFSDDAFPLVLPKVYNGSVKKLLDIGGNTGKWSIASVQYAEDVHVTIMDLPGQLNMAMAKIAELGLSDRISFTAGNVLDESVKFPKGFDAIWMSQFLDCFSDVEIISILKRCYNALDENGRVFVMEPFWDNQKFEVAAFCLQQTSLYFTAIAN